MCFVFPCAEEQRELGRRQAPGSCPYCGGKVLAIDVESQCRFCFLPICYKIKKRYFCSICSKRLELYH